MKKFIVLMIALIMALVLCACGGDEDTSVIDDEGGTISVVDDEGENGNVVLLQQGDLWVAVDTETSPFNDAGISILIDKSEKKAMFTKTNAEGVETLEYYLFDYNAMTMEKFKYMDTDITGFYYLYDLNNDELIKIEDMVRDDATQAAKDDGSWDTIVEEIEFDIQALYDYFEFTFGKTIEELTTEE